MIPNTSVSLALAFVVALVAGCAAQSTQETADKNLAIRDLIELSELEPVNRMRTDRFDGWNILTTEYLIYKTRRGDFLVEFGRPCWELQDPTTIVADERSDPNVIRARFDTIRGCRINAIYAVNEEQSEELFNIGEPPGSED